MTLLDIEIGRKEGKIIGFTASTFDLLHAGHCLMLQESKAHCDILVVGFLTDPTISRPNTKNKPIQTVVERWAQLQAVGVVDLIIPFETEDDLVEIIKLVNPTIRFVGQEYENTEFTGKALCPIFYNRRNHEYSSSSLRKRL